VNGLADCYDHGLVSAVGVSNYGARELRRVARDFDKRGVPLASAQVSVCVREGAGAAQHSSDAATMPTAACSAACDACVRPGPVQPVVSWVCSG
jgi:diketogulonate reductase-like aldo/keto reductase